MNHLLILRVSTLTKLVSCDERRHVLAEVHFLVSAHAPEEKQRRNHEEPGRKKP